MKEEIQRLKEQFSGAKTEKEYAKIDRQMAILAESPEAFANGMLEAIRETNQEAREIVLREKLKEILPAISVSYLARTYFKKTPYWFYHRLNGNLVNGKPAKFTKDELITLAEALTDISEKIHKSATFIV